ncbi:MAG: DUF3857 domain-containing protein [Bacteroidales bacterium]|nr:DUF3857 domain-containing protein [Bacteroidales bacterium]
MYKYIISLAIITSLSVADIYSQNYPVVNIPDSLKENAHCIIRNYTREFELQLINKGVEKNKIVYTIFDEIGEEMAYMVIHYDKNSSVRINQIEIYNSFGKTIRKVKQSEITDSPYLSGYTLYSDDRIKYFKPDYPEYPYTIEYDFEIKFDNMISYGCWRPVSYYNMSVEHAKLVLTYPNALIINKKEINITEKSVETLKNTDLTNKTWELNNYKAIEDEPFDNSLYERIPCVYLMPSELIYEKYKGTATNWEEYGKWLCNLYNGKNELSDAEKLNIENLVKDTPDTLERIKILYKYMQEKTRYVNISLGIGGFQPFDAKTVSETGYGDCKALSNYLHSLLKFIGIKSYPSLVSCGRYITRIFDDFPNFSQFNHVILCVPNSNDTIWLECTDQKIPFGFLGDFTDDRDVLLITENGGIFAHTRKYEAEHNIRICNSEIKIDSEGTAAFSLKTSYQGLQYYDIFGFLYSNFDEQKKWLYKNSRLPSSQITDFSIDDNKKDIPFASIKESVISKNYTSFSGKYMLLPLNVINVQTTIQKMLKTRHSDIVIQRSFIDYDTLIYQIPKNYIVESVPSGKTINSIFGDYSYSVIPNEKGIIYVRKFLLKQGRYKPSEYKDLYEFFLSISKSDNIKLILKKS